MQIMSVLKSKWIAVKYLSVQIDSLVFGVMSCIRIYEKGSSRCSYESPSAHHF